MKTKTSFGRCLSILINKHKVRQMALAEKCGIAQATISRIMSTSQSLDDEVAKALCNCWPTRADNIQLLIAGLSDIIRRWGFDPDADVDINARGTVTPPVPTQSDVDMETLRSHLDDAAVADLIHDLALILRRADRTAPYDILTDRSGNGSSIAAEKE